MLRRFYQRSGSVYGIPYDHASSLATVLDCIVRGICLVGDKSCAGALMLPFPYNRSRTVAQVVFWYFENKREIAIFDALLRDCRQAGADFVDAAALPPHMTGKRFYGVRGMAPVEMHFLGSLENHCKTPPKG